mmetsp:Transcript_19928/g.28216  ORF Transcript_19928/g.28216 Transcript_19928/m.28216 type:complete len:142 (+) Transcript_19928:1413-1838(+)
MVEYIPLPPVPICIRTLMVSKGCPTITEDDPATPPAIKSCNTVTCPCSAGKSGIDLSLVGFLDIVIFVVTGSDPSVETSIFQGDKSGYNNVVIWWDTVTEAMYLILTKTLDCLVTTDTLILFLKGNVELGLESNYSTVRSV